MLDAAFVLISALIFMMLYGLKGGWGGIVFVHWADARKKNSIIDRLLDGKTLNLIGSLAYFLIVTHFSWYGLPALLLAGAWTIGVAPSMGEESGAIGDMEGWWGDYKVAVDPAGTPYFTRSYGVKKGVQRGIFLMAPLALLTNCGYLLIAGALYVPVVFIFQELKRRITGQRDWSWTEPAIGFVCGTALGILFTSSRVILGL